MKKIVCVIILTTSLSIIQAQLYFPPNGSNVWDTIAPSDLGWCQNKIDSLYDFLNATNSKAFVLLKDGEIVLEKYFNGHSSSTNWYWASAGKTLTAFMVGIAQQENFLNINDTTSSYLGQGWTNCTPSLEEKITIWHQLTMNSGLDDGVADNFCTIDTCLQYLSDAGARWAYHNAPYTLLDQVLENATSQALNIYTHLKVKSPIGMDGLYVQQGYNNVYLSTARSMARFGLLILNNGAWDGNQIMTDSIYFNQMISTSQNLNNSYGFLWWLNGKSNYMLPQTQIVFNGSITPQAPNDMIAALGLNGQIINVVPSQNIVWIRMGDSPSNSLVPNNYNDDIWSYINDLPCNTSDINETNLKISVYPNPVGNFISLNSLGNQSVSKFELINMYGQIIRKGMYENKIDIGSESPGVYLLRIYDSETHFLKTLKVIKR